MNTLMPLGNKINKSANTINQSIKNSANAVKNMSSAAAKNTMSMISAPLATLTAPFIANKSSASPATSASPASSASPANASSTGFYVSISIFVALVLTFIVVFTYFSNELIYGWNNLVSSLRTLFGYTTPVDSSTVATPRETTKDDTEPVTSNDLLEKILPGSKEVFNISKNSYTFYDAEPLCKALGAELATYDQVKEAWAKGADWCNYGWIKGQQALYPTQKETYDKIQLGPEGDRMKCGEVGLNGGYFDNPEERFGVNCFGPKPAQSLHDVTLIEKGAPVNPDVIDFNVKVAKFKTNAGNMGLMPYNSSKWSSG